jgi:hypothetical protein
MRHTSVTNGRQRIVSSLLKANRIEARSCGLHPA